MKDRYIVLASIISLTILEAIALLKGINGTLFTIALAIIAGLGGYVIPSPLMKGGK